VSTQFRHIVRDFLGGIHHTCGPPEKVINSLLEPPGTQKGDVL